MRKPVKVRWPHIFPDNVERVVVLTVNATDVDYQTAIEGICYEDGRLLERVDYDDVMESIGQNVAMHDDFLKKPVAKILKD